MTQRNNSADNHTQHSCQQSLPTRRFASTLPAQSLCWLSSFSLLTSGGLVLAQTEAIDNIVPAVENSQPASTVSPVKKQASQQQPTASAPETTQSQPDFSQRRSNLRQRLRKIKTSRSNKPVKNAQPSSAATQPVVVNRQSSPRVGTSRKLRVNSQRSTQGLPAIVINARRKLAAYESSAQSRDSNNAYIDTNNYQTGASEKYEAPNSVVLTDRSSGCRTVLSQGGSNQLCAQASQTRLRKPAPSWMRRSQPTQLASAASTRRPIAPARESGWRTVSRVVTGNVNRSQLRSSPRIALAPTPKSTYHPNQFIPKNLIPTTTVSSTPIAPAGGALSAPLTANNTAPRPSTVAYNIPLASTLPQIVYRGVQGSQLAYGGTGLLYPLAVPASITSLFGWRTHPITGDRRFHAGTDLGAAMGTPILAADSGQVETANWLGGYGLTVILAHNNARQTLYGHMSEIYVQPGQRVERGTVIGRVGSTGNSTGPHLHFEVRQLTPQGWVATDPGVHLEYALHQLLQTLRTAQAPQEPGS